MKKRYQIDREKAVRRFESQAARGDQEVQLHVPLKQIAAALQEGVGELMRQAGLELMQLIREEEVRQLAGQRLAASALLLALLPFQVALGGQQRIAAQLVVIVAIFVPQRQRLDPLRDQLPNPGFDERGMAPLLEAGGQARQPVDAPVDLAPQQCAAVAADHPAVKLGAHLAAKLLGKREARWGTLCNRRAACLLGR